MAALEVLPDPFRSMACTLVDICAYAGTGNVLKIQSLLHILSDHYEASEKEEKKEQSKMFLHVFVVLFSILSYIFIPGKKKDDKKSDDKKADETPLDLSSQQSVAVLGLALIAMGEDIGSEMLFR